MKVKFYKYQGTGNDFIMIDNRELSIINKPKSTIEKLCHRRFGIGADGLILLEEEQGYDFKMVYFNSDGNQSSMCGNGGRCIVQFAQDLDVIKNSTTFLAVDGQHEAFLKEGLVHLKMIDVSGIERNNQFDFLNTGSPHYISYVDNIQSFPVYEEGSKIRNNDRFKLEGTNVNFVNINGNNLWVRTYERGVEDETFSCGTGVTAAAISASFKGLKSPVNITTLGGSLQVSFEKNENDFKNIYLTGPAEKVYEGFIEL